MSALLSFGLVACFREAPGVQGYLFPFIFYLLPLLCNLLHFSFSLLIIAITTVIIIHKVFFIIPCLDVYQKIDMRTSSYDVPPQEVCCLVIVKDYLQRMETLSVTQKHSPPDPNKGQCDCVCECNHVL